jgi:hypothetical protein
MKPDDSQISIWCNKYNQSPETLAPLIEDVAVWASTEERRECVEYLNKHHIRSIATNLNLYRASATTSRKQSAIFALDEISTIKEIGPSRIARIRQALEYLPND